MPYKPETYNLDNQIDCLRFLEQALLEIEEGHDLRLSSDNSKVMNSLYFRIHKYIKAYRVQTATDPDRYQDLVISRVKEEDGLYVITISSAAARSSDINAEGVER